MFRNTPSSQPSTSLLFTQLTIIVIGDSEQSNTLSPLSILPLLLALESEFSCLLSPDLSRPCSPDYYSNDESVGSSDEALLDDSYRSNEVIQVYSSLGSSPAASDVGDWDESYHCGYSSVGTSSEISDNEAEFSDSESEECVVPLFRTNNPRLKAAHENLDNFFGGRAKQLAEADANREESEEEFIRALGRMYESQVERKVPAVKTEFKTSNPDLKNAYDAAGGFFSNLAKRQEVAVRKAQTANADKEQVSTPSLRSSH